MNEYTDLRDRKRACSPARLGRVVQGTMGVRRSPYRAVTAAYSVSFPAPLFPTRQKILLIPPPPLLLV